MNLTQGADQGQLLAESTHERSLQEFQISDARKPCLRHTRRSGSGRRCSCETNPLPNSLITQDLGKTRWRPVQVSAADHGTWRERPLIIIGSRGPRRPPDRGSSGQGFLASFVFLFAPSFPMDLEGSGFRRDGGAGSEEHGHAGPLGGNLVGPGHERAVGVVGRTGEG